MERPKKNSEMLVGRAGRIAIEQEDRARDARRGINKDRESKREEIKTNNAFHCLISPKMRAMKKYVALGIQDSFFHALI